MKKIGFIDYYLDEWHADKYPDWIKNGSNGQMEVAYAYGKIDKPGGQSNVEWCTKQGIELLPDIRDVVAKSDYLIILSPDHPEYHVELSTLALQSGKPTYIDKTFAPDRRTAMNLFELADKNRTPMYSSSALRFAEEYREVEREGIESICSIGPGEYQNYSIHQVEPIVSLMGTQAKRVMWIGTARTPALLIGFADGRQATINQYGAGCPFSMLLNYESGSAKTLTPESDFFQNFIKQLVGFFESGKPTVKASETIAIITILEFGLKASLNPYQWIELPIL